MVHPKFIIETDEIEGDCIIIGKCTYHNQLVTDKTKVKGGGWWSLSEDKTTFTLYGKSHEYQGATLEDIIDCVRRGKVFRNQALIGNLTEKHKFQYKTEVGEIIEISPTD